MSVGKFVLVAGLMLAATVGLAPVLDPWMARGATALSGGRACVSPSDPGVVITPMRDGSVPSERMSFRFAGGNYLILLVAFFASRRRWDARGLASIALVLAASAAGLLLVEAMHLAVIASWWGPARALTRALLPYPHLLAGYVMVIVVARMLRLSWLPTLALLVASRLLFHEGSVVLVLLLIAALPSVSKRSDLPESSDPQDIAPQGKEVCPAATQERGLSAAGAGSSPCRPGS